jgi:hypothetical protein
MQFECVFSWMDFTRIYTIAMQKFTSTLTLRKLTPLEAITPELLPPELRDFGFPYLIPNWCWVVERRGDPIVLVVTSMAHGILFFWRILSTASGRRGSLNQMLAALPAIIDNARLRGCLGYGTFLSDSPTEAKLARIIVKQGGAILPFTGMIAMNLNMPKGEG